MDITVVGFTHQYVTSTAFVLKHGPLYVEFAAQPLVCILLTFNIACGGFGSFWCSIWLT